MITYKKIDYKNAKFTEDEMLDYCKKFGVKLDKAGLDEIKKVAKPKLVKLIKTTEYTGEFDYKEPKIEEVEAKETPKFYVVDGMRLSKSDFVEYGKAFGHSFRVTYKLAM